MHNAGYVHLYCLERFFDFPHICSSLQVLVENPHLPKEPRGKNKMRLSCDAKSHEAEKFIRSCETHRLSKHYPHFSTPNRPHQITLNLRRYVKHVAAQPRLVKQAREERSSKLSMVDRHLGDLAVETEYRRQTRLAVHQVRRKTPKPASIGSP